MKVERALSSCFGGVAFLVTLLLTAQTSTVLAQSTATYYVAPDGKPSGDGSMQNPLDLATALSGKSSAKPGNVIYLRGGIYKGQFTSALTGAENNPIIVRQYPGERAIIDGIGAVGNIFQVDGAWTWYWGLEIMNSDPNRYISTPGSNPPDARPDGVRVMGPNTKIINFIVHDAGGGINCWTPAKDAELYGNIIYYNGVQSPDRAHGHGIYAQNQTGIKRIVDNLVFNQFGEGLHNYGSDLASLNNFYLEGNIAFNNGILSRDGIKRSILVGGGSIAENPTLISNYTYNGQTNLGYRDGCRKTVFRDNFFAGTSVLLAIKCQFDVFSGNKLYGYTYMTESSLPSPAPNNTYLDAPPTTGIDVFVRPNKYEPGRAHLVVYNWGKKSVVTVDLSGVLKTGAKYEIRDAQNFFGNPVVKGTYDGNSIALPMNLTEVTRPIGDVPTPPVHTGLEFGVFILLPGSTTAATPTIDPYGGTFADSVTVTLATTTPGASIRYTTGGNPPSITSTLYAGPFTLTRSAVVQAKAFHSDYNSSGVAQASFTINSGQTVTTPLIKPNGGTFTNFVVVALETATPSATIRYTLDGSEPASTATLYNGPFTLSKSATVKARAFRDGYNTSQVVVAFFTINLTNTNGGLIGHWTMNSNDINGSVVYDKSGNANNGMIHGATISSGRVGQALTFDEIDDYVSMPDLNYGSNFSVSFWFKVTDNAGNYYQYLYSHGSAVTPNSLNVWFGEGPASGIPGVLRTSFLDANDATNSLLDVPAGYADGNWHFYAITVGNGQTIVYVDAQNKASNANGGDPFDPATTIYLGSREDLDKDRFFGGGIDEVRIYNRALSAGEVFQIYQQVDACKSLPDAAAYGRIIDGDQSHIDKVTYCFQGTAGDMFLTYQVYDIDTNGEVVILLNGQKILDVQAGPNEQWSPDRTALLPDALVQDGVSNLLEFNNPKNPPNILLWGVRQVQVGTCKPLPDAAAYGRILGGDQSHIEKVIYSFQGTAGDMFLTYQVYDIDTNGEIVVLLNGQKVFAVQAGPNEQWSSDRTALLPDALVQDGVSNLLEFNNLKNPPNILLWGVRQVRVSPTQGTNKLLNVVAIANRTNGTAPLSVQFNGSDSADSNDTITAYAWDFGDGSTASVANPAHTYNVAGAYNARLIVTDNQGAKNTAFVSIKVSLATESTVPEAYVLEQNYPNPFNPQTNVAFVLPGPGEVRLSIYNSVGQPMRKPLVHYYDAGRHTIRLNASNWPSGVYFYEIQVNGFRTQRKMILSK